MSTKQQTRVCLKKIAPKKSTKTPIRRLQTVKKILRDIGEADDDLTPLQDAHRIIDHINTRWSNCHTRISKLAHTIGHLRDLFDSDYALAIFLYRQEMKKHFAQRTHDMNKNIKSAADKRNWLDWEDILNATAALTDPYERAALDLYTTIPPRRTEYRTLLIISKQKDIIMDGETNYINTGIGDSSPPQIILQRYKTCRSKGVYYINKVPPSVIALAITRGNGCYLFEHKTRSQQGWSAFLGNIFFRTKGRRCAINIIRK